MEPRNLTKNTRPSDPAPARFSGRGFLARSFNSGRSAANLTLPLLLVLFALFLSACADQPATVVEMTPTLAAAATPAPAAPGELTVDAAINRGPINPNVYGANYGPWSAVPANALEDVEQSGLNFLRFPGGNWGDDNFVRPNHVDMLKLFAGMIDADITVSVNLREGTPEQAVKLMQLMEEKEVDVAYWSIGNEPNLFSDRIGRDFWDTEYYNTQWREFAEAMLAHDPHIRLVGPNLSQFLPHEHQNPKDARGRDWMREFLRANGDLVDNVSFHRYPFGGTPSIEEVRPTSAQWDETIPFLRKLIREETGRDIPVSVMEVNSNWSHAVGGEATPDSFYNAIWWADSLGRLISQDVEMVAFFTLAHTDGTSLLAIDEPRPTYYVYQLYKQFGDEKLYADVGIENVSLFAAERDDGAVTLIAVNRGAEAVKGPLNLANYDGPQTAVLHRFDTDHKAKNLGQVSIDELELPGYSISLYVLPGV